MGANFFTQFPRATTSNSGSGYSQFPDGDSSGGSGGGGGGIVSSGSVAANAIVRFSGTTGSVIQSSTLILSDTGTISGSASFATDVSINSGNRLLLNNGSTSAFVGLRAPSALATSYTLTYPTGTGINGQFLTTDGSGVLSWTSSSGGGSSGTLAVGAYNSAASSTNGAVIGSNSLFLQDGTLTNPGLISSASQNFSGVKRFAGNVGIGNIQPTALLTVSSNTASILPPDETLIHMIGADAARARLSIDAHNAITGGGAGLMTRRSRGTAGSPTNVLADDTLGFFGSLGYGTTTFGSATSVSVSLRASQNHTDVNRGSYLQVSVTANSTTSSAARMILQENGVFQLPAYVGAAGVLTIGSGGTLVSGSVDLTAQVVGSLPAANGGLTQVAQTITGPKTFVSSTVFQTSLTVQSALPLFLSNGSSSASIGFRAPSTLPVTYVLTFPVDAGTPNQVLTTGSSGILSWTTPSTSGLTVGPFGGASATADGATIGSGFLYMQGFTATLPGLVSSASQTFAGLKTFNSTVNLNNLSASLPLQLDAGKNIVSSAISLNGSSTQITGILSIPNGGTGGGDAQGARYNLGVANRIMLLQDVVSSGSAGNQLTPMPGMGFTAIASMTYYFRAMINTQSDATSTGDRFVVSGSTTPFRLSYRSVSALTTTTQTINHGLTAFDLPAATGATTAATGGNINIVEGLVTMNQTSSVTIRFASELAGPGITATAGSLLEWQQLGT